MNSQTKNAPINMSNINILFTLSLAFVLSYYSQYIKL